MFKVGDKVKFLNEEGGGKVIEVKKDVLVVETEDGFDYEYPFKEVIQESTDEYYIPDRAIEESINQEESLAKNKSYYKKFNHLDKMKNTDEMEVDLHIESLISSHAGMANYQIVEIQMANFRRNMNVAVSKGMRRVVFIHGVGAGILRQEIRNELKAYYPEFEFMDGAYHRYGYGATEVLLQG